MALLDDNSLIDLSNEKIPNGKELKTNNLRKLKILMIIDWMNFQNLFVNLKIEKILTRNLSRIIFSSSAWK